MLTEHGRGCVTYITWQQYNGKDDIKGSSYKPLQYCTFNRSKSRDAD